MASGRSAFYEWPVTRSERRAFGSVNESFAAQSSQTRRVYPDRDWIGSGFAKKLPKGDSTG
jgi:hypothetical protein